MFYVFYKIILRLTENYIASLLLDEISSNGKLDDIVAYELWVE